MVCRSGNKPTQKPYQFTVADFAGPLDAINEPAICLPIAGASTWQACASPSTPRATTAATNFAYMAELPDLQFPYEISESTIRVCKTGSTPTMHTTRTSAAWMHEVLNASNITLVYDTTHRVVNVIYGHGTSNITTSYTVQNNRSTKGNKSKTNEPYE